jgi:putative membrane protein
VTVFLRWLLASLHLLAFGIGLGAIWVRGRSLRSPHDPAAIRRALRADAWWGIAALLWLATGLPRLFLGLDKPTSYYIHNHVFWLKMALFLLIFLLEMGPMITFAGWRRAMRRGASPDTSSAPRWAMVSRIQLVLLILILFTATAVARAFGA